LFTSSVFLECHGEAALSMIQHKLQAYKALRVMLRKSDRNSSTQSSGMSASAHQAGGAGSLQHRAASDDIILTADGRTEFRPFTTSSASCCRTATMSSSFHFWSKYGILLRCAAVAEQQLLGAAGSLQHQAASAIRAASDDIIQQVQELLIHRPLITSRHDIRGHADREVGPL
jgi:hypothetical protein